MWTGRVSCIFVFYCKENANGKLCMFKLQFIHASLDLVYRLRMDLLLMVKMQDIQELVELLVGLKEEKKNFR